MAKSVFQNSTIDTPSNPGVREITQTEVDHFRKNGWVILRQFMAPSSVAQIKERATQRMGTDPQTVTRLSPDERIENEYNWYARWDGPSHADDWIKSFSHSNSAGSMAAAATELSGSTIRFYFDHIFTKRPASKSGGPTPWHQDLPHHPLDRQGGLTMWTPLVDCPAEMGTMRFLNGSHKAGIFGRFLNRSDGVSLVDEYPDVIKDFEVSDPLDMKVGDTTVHNLAVIHHAPENLTDKPRWVYACQWLPVKARFTGAPNHRTDGLNMPIDQPLDHPMFPVIEVRK